MDNNKHLGLRVNSEIHAKLKYISEQEHRSNNQQVIYIISQYILKYEQENGKINLDKK